MISMKNKYVFVAAMLLVLSAAGIGLTNLYVSYEQGGGSAEPDAFHVVTSFYPMYIAAENIIGGCEGVSVQNLSEPQTGCLHDYQLTTEDMASLSEADVFVVNGGGIESFLPDVAARCPTLSVINASEQIDLLEDNAHAWMSLPEHMLQVQTIADSLARLDSGHRAVYQENCAHYLAELQELYAQQQETAQASGAANVVIFHEAFDYVAGDYGLSVAGSMDLDEERQVSAGETADIIRKINENGVTLILAEELYGKQMCETVERETGIRTVYLDTCVRGDYDADSYLNAMRENIRRMEEALNIFR